MAQGEIQLDPRQESYEIAGHARICKVSSQQQTWQEAKEATYQPFTKAAFNQPTDQVFWLQFRLANRDVERIIQVRRGGNFARLG